MNVKKAIFTEDERSEILAALKEEHPPHVYKRLMALKLKAVDNLSSEDAGKYAGLHKTSVNMIIRRFQEQGIKAIVEKRHNHGNRYMTFDQETAFLSRFKERSEAARWLR